MGLFDFFRRKKKDQEEAQTTGAGPLCSLDDVDPAAIVPPETRYTQEYQDFLAAQEASSPTQREQQ